MNESHKEVVAQSLNSAILASMNLPSQVALEKLIQQVCVAQDTLYQLRSKALLYMLLVTN
jgi:hypothetical protein